MDSEWQRVLQSHLSIATVRCYKILLIFALVRSIVYATATCLDAPHYLLSYKLTYKGQLKKTPDPSWLKLITFVSDASFSFSPQSVVTDVDTQFYIPLDLLFTVTFHQHTLLQWQWRTNTNTPFTHCRDILLEHEWKPLWRSGPCRMTLCCK